MPNYGDTRALVSSLYFVSDIAQCSIVFVKRNCSWLIRKPFCQIWYKLIFINAYRLQVSVHTFVHNTNNIFKINKNLCMHWTTNFGLTKIFLRKRLCSAKCILTWRKINLEMCQRIKYWNCSHKKTSHPWGSKTILFRCPKFSKTC